ncbi:hypothetical protein PhCBS80983_g03970 [Powellomyces hirtus]|uniref:Uncharacterized protein n=1 Tax=Powellomyces hirtus TaxID=109895 RepID=A0A507E0E7_9FUNG|nr:hypothetical protein PhCBS80983_g03970 [Powellomyces hirtus]
MTPGTFLRPSPGEEERLKQEAHKKAKLRRLAQVREQERKLAAERRGLYKATAGNEWGHAIRHFEARWAVEQDQKLLSLCQAEIEQEKHIGAGHHSAKDTSVQQRVKTELDRGDHARSKEDTDREGREAVSNYRRILMDSVRQVEDERATQMAWAHRMRVANTADDVEIPSNPTQRIILKSRYDGRFDDTCIHRTNVAATCAVPVRADDAWQEARRAAQLKEKEDERNRQIAERLKENTQQRSDDAEYNIAMSKQKGALIKALDTLYNRDRRNKIQAVNADVLRPTRLKPTELETRFAEIFDLGVPK